MNIDPPFKTFIDQISKKFQDSAELKQQLDFNIFSLVSDKYVLENFHSDIISKLLDPNSGHGEGLLFLENFLEALKYKNDHLNFSTKLFEDATVEREENRIDILIKSNKNRCAIIIENKINGAIDQDKQLQRYYKKLEHDGFDIVAVVYLTLYGEQNPDTTNWEIAYRKKILEKLVRLPAFQSLNYENLERHDLISLWIEKCARVAKDNNREIFNQYRNLILKVTSKMENAIANVEMFERFLNDKNLLKQSIDFYLCMQTLPNYLAQRICSEIPKFKSSGNSASIPNFKFDNTKLVVVVVVELSNEHHFFYSLRVWDTNYEVNGTVKVLEFLKDNVEVLSLKDNGQNELARAFSFPEEVESLRVVLNQIIKLMP